MAVAAPQWLARTLGEWGRLSPYVGITRQRGEHSGRTSPEDTKQAS
jgi:hypothetical protein